MKTAARLLLVGSVCLGLSGCMARIMDFTLISTKNVDLPGQKGPRVEGEDMVDIIVLFPTGQANIKTAVDHAIENGHGDALQDVVISNKFWYIPYVFGQAGFVVEGSIVDTSKAPKAVPTGAPPAASAPVAASAAAAEPVALSSYDAAQPGQTAPEAPRAKRLAPLTQTQANAELLP